MSKATFPLMFLLFHSPIQAQWVQQPFPSTEYLTRVHFVNADTGWIFGGEYIYKTIDGGASWIPQDSTGALGLVLAAINADTVLYANYAGRLRRTSDGGTTWQTVDDHGAYFEDITFADPATGFLVGSDDNAPSAIWKTTDGGLTWEMVADTLAPAEFNCVGVSFVDPLNGWVLTYDDEMFKTTDGGVTWTHVDSFHPSYQPMSSDDIQFIDQDHGWAVGGLNGTIYIDRTTDGGATWWDTTGVGSTRQMEFVDQQNGWIVQGLADMPMRTTDGGVTWERQLSGQLPPMDGIDMINDRLGWIVGGGGTVYKTTTGGGPLLPDSLLDFFPLQVGNKWQYRVSWCNCGCQTVHESYFVEEVVGDTVLENGYQYQIIEWDSYPYVRYMRVDSVTGNVYRVQFGEEDLMDSILATPGSWFTSEGWIPTECTEVAPDTIFGITTTVKRFTQYFVFGAEFEVSRGFGRTLHIRYEDDPCYPQLYVVVTRLVYALIDGEEYGTLVGVEEEPPVPNQFSLEQNFPNPFNPATTIRYSLPAALVASLKIFNLLGEEVATLVSGPQDAGWHEVEWNATGRPSGVYFFRLTAPGYVDTKKLVLLR